MADVTKVALMQRFSDQQEFSQRGQLVISKDSKGRILSIKTDEQASPIGESEFKAKAEKGAYYQLSIPDLNLLSSTPASYYSSMIGLEDTLTFTLDFEQSSIVGFQVEYVNKPNKAKRMANPKKKREYLSKQFEQWSSKSILSTMTEGVRPAFERLQYDSLGGELKSKAQLTKEQQAATPENQSFIQKYWWHLLVGFMVFNTFFGGSEEPRQGQAGGAASAPAARK